MKVYTIGTKVFGDWEIVREIGEGAYGKVFELQKTTGGVTTRSALKLIRIPHSSSDYKDVLSEGMDEKSATEYFREIVDQLVKEIQMMAELKSYPNIVTYEDHQIIEHEDAVGWDILIRMELLTSLTDYQIAHPMGEAEVRQLGIDICQALEFCQKKGVIHRDIKPGNIFVSEAGQFKLGDFGVARTVEKTVSSMSRQGTESYMAPEVYKNKSYGASVDIYSLGIVLYRLMNGGRLPFFPPAPQPVGYSDRESALGRRMKGEAFPLPSDASPGFSAVILKACAYTPGKRYRTAVQMKNAIQTLDSETADEEAEELVPGEEERRRREEEERLRKEEQERRRKGEEERLRREKEERRRKEEEEHLRREEAEQRGKEKNIRQEKTKNTSRTIGCIGVIIVILGLLLGLYMIASIVHRQNLSKRMESTYNGVLGHVGTTGDISIDGITAKTDVTEVWFLDTLEAAPEDAADVSILKNGSVLCWTSDTVQYIAADGGVKGFDCGCLFYWYENLIAVHFSGNFDTSELKNVFAMFYGCAALTTLDVSGWDTSNVTDMSRAFLECVSLTTLDVSGWDTSNVTNMLGAFCECESLTTLDVSGWDTSNVTDMSWAFCGCESLTTLDVSGWDTSNVTDMSCAFLECVSLTTLDVSGWDTSDVTYMSSAFSGCESLTTLDVSGWDTSDVTDMLDAFSGCESLTTLDVSGWDTSDVTYMSGAFSGCESLTTLDVSGWDTSNVTDMSLAFYGCESLTTLDVSGWDTSNVTNMTCAFSGCKSLTTLDVSEWNTSNVTTVYYMFYGCESLTNLDTSNWDLSSATDVLVMYGS